MTPKNILIVEDDADNRMVLAKLLRRHGLEPTECGTLREAKAVIQMGGIDCIVLDLGLPDSEPESTLRMIPEIKDVPVVVYTGIEDAELIGKSFQAGACSVITKGSSADIIIEKIRLCMARDHPEDIENSREIWKNRRESYHPEPVRAPWFTTSKALATMAAAGIGHLVVLVSFIWNQSASNALFRKQVDDTAKSLALVEPRVTSLEEKATRSIDDRLQLNKRIDLFQGEIGGLRTDMNGGFNRMQDTQNTIYKILIEKSASKP